MVEKLKIVVDDKGISHLWMDGKEVHGLTKIKFECEVNELPIVGLDFLVPAISFGGEKNEKQ